MQTAEFVYNLLKFNMDIDDDTVPIVTKVGDDKMEYGRIF